MKNYGPRCVLGALCLVLTGCVELGPDDPGTSADEPTLTSWDDGRVATAGADRSEGRTTSALVTEDATLSGTFGDIRPSVDDSVTSQASYHGGYLQLELMVSGPGGVAMAFMELWDLKAGEGLERLLTPGRVFELNGPQLDATLLGCAGPMVNVWSYDAFADGGTVAVSADPSAPNRRVITFDGSFWTGSAHTSTLTGSVEVILTPTQQPARDPG